MLNFPLFPTEERISRLLAIHQGICNKNESYSVISREDLKIVSEKQFMHLFKRPRNPCSGFLLPIYGPDSQRANMLLQLKTWTGVVVAVTYLMIDLILSSVKCREP